MPRPPDKPTFLVLGAAKSGTTSLCTAVARHPDVFFSRPKEPVFFEREYDRGLDYYWETYFSGWDGQPAVGEGRVYNLYLPFVPPRIRESLPEARLIAILRDPVERAHSHWWHRVSRGYERRSFEEAVEDELAELEAGRTFEAPRNPETWTRNFYPGTRGSHADVREVRYLEMGRYAEQLRRYTDLFPLDRLQVLLLEDLVASGRRTVRELWGFLGLDPSREEADVEERNVAGDRVKGRMAFLLERVSWKLGLTDRVPKSWRTAVRKILSRGQRERPGMSSEQRKALASHFAPCIEELEAMLGRDLRGWKR